MHENASIYSGDGALAAVFFRAEGTADARPIGPRRAPQIRSAPRRTLR
jgi:hypothetical protein